MQPVERARADHTAGNRSDWTGAHTDIDEVMLSGADAIVAAADGAVSAFAFTDLGAGSDIILALVASARLARDGAAPGNAQFATRSAGTTYFGRSQPVGASYENYREVWYTDPATGAGWTRAAINAAELGLKAVA